MIRHTFLAASALAGACAIAACGGASAAAHPPATASPAAAAQPTAAARSTPTVNPTPATRNTGHGTRIAMELDINPEWVQLDAAGIPGGALIAEIPGQYRPSGQYLAGWTRDFFTVLAPPAGPAGTPPPSARIRP